MNWSMMLLMIVISVLIPNFSAEQIGVSPCGRKVDKESFSLTEIDLLCDMTKGQSRVSNLLRRLLNNYEVISLGGHPTGQMVKDLIGQLKSQQKRTKQLVQSYGGFPWNDLKDFKSLKSREKRSSPSLVASSMTSKVDGKQIPDQITKLLSVASSIIKAKQSFDVVIDDLKQVMSHEVSDIFKFNFKNLNEKRKSNIKFLIEQLTKRWSKSRRLSSQQQQFHHHHQIQYNQPEVDKNDLTGGQLQTSGQTPQSNPIKLLESLALLIPAIKSQTENQNANSNTNSNPANLNSNSNTNWNSNSNTNSINSNTPNSNSNTPSSGGSSGSSGGGWWNRIRNFVTSIQFLNPIRRLIGFRVANNNKTNNQSSSSQVPSSSSSSFQISSSSLEIPSASASSSSQITNSGNELTNLILNPVNNISQLAQQRTSNQNQGSGIGTGNTNNLNNLLFNLNKFNPLKTPSTQFTPEKYQPQVNPWYYPLETSKFFYHNLNSLTQFKSPTTSSTATSIWKPIFPSQSHEKQKQSTETMNNQGEGQVHDNKKLSEGSLNNEETKKQEEKSENHDVDGGEIKEDSNDKSDDGLGTGSSEGSLIENLDDLKAQGYTYTIIPIYDSKYSKDSNSKESQETISNSKEAISNSNVESGSGDGNEPDL